MATSKLALAGTDPDGFLRLVAEPVSQQLYGATEARSSLWGYNGSVPGPDIRVRQGARVQVRLENRLDVPTTLHWHGVRIENAYDGVSGLTQPPVPPGQTFDYDFVAPDAGTYWYHAHHESWRQVARGLYGPLIVEEADNAFPPAADITLMLDDWRLDEEGVLQVASLGAPMDWSHAGRLGNWPTVNGATRPTIALSAGQPTRLRLINAANARVFNLAPGRMNADIIALDGRALADPIRTNEIVKLAPAQRMDLLIKPSPDLAALTEHTAPAQPFEIADFAVSAPGHIMPTRALQPAPVSPPDRAADHQLTLTMAGGAMGRMGGTVYKGAPLTGERLMETKQFWSFNGVANMTDTPFFAARLGDYVEIETVNETRWPHAIHFHGHHFKILSSTNEDQFETGQTRDTFFIEPQQRVRIGLVADNPGKWLMHCHMLEHAAAGMVTWFDVS